MTLDSSKEYADLKKARGETKERFSDVRRRILEAPDAVRCQEILEGEKWLHENSLAKTHLEHLAYELCGAREYAKAEGVTLQLLGVLQEWHGTNSPPVLNQLVGLARIYRAQEQRANAERIYKYVLTLAIDLGGLNPQDFTVHMAAEGLARLYREQGKDVQAEDVLRRAIPDISAAFNDPEIFSAFLKTRAEFYRHVGEAKKADAAEQLRRSVSNE